MNKHVQKLTLILLISFTSILPLSAQSTGTATIDNYLLVELNTESPLASDYVIDISNLSFKNQQAAEWFFNRLHDNLMTYTVDYPAKKATLHIDLKHMQPQGWGVAEYNDYFIKATDRYRQTFDAVNK
jgi:hypothetical protein